MSDAASQPRCGFVAVIGAPNSGKSTLINRLVGAKVAIVTHKAQTTRARLRAIAIVEPAQIIFVDTPGIFEPRRRFDAAMVEAAWQGVAEADVAALVVDAAHGLDDPVARILETLRTPQAKTILVLNKIDLVKRERLLGLAAAMNERFAFERTFMICALNGDGIGELRGYLAGAMPPGPWLYPPDQVADMPLRVLAAEITREKLFLRLHDELPYASTVETESWQERADGSVRIEQVIYVERDSQRSIVLGRNGRTIKAIGQAAREEIADMLGQKVHLFLFVKVRADWARDPERLTMMGLGPGGR